MHAHFVTLTYDTSHVPISDNGFMTLRKRDFQLYMKRLRKLCSDSVLKYYVAGEYGDKNKRPHYHAIIFNCPDKSFFDKAWQLGTVDVGTVTAESVAYTMKYIDKQNGHIRKFYRDDRAPEFSLMSKGLGASYVTPDMVAYHQADFSRNFATKEGGFRIALPRYYRDRVYSLADKEEQLLIILHSVSEADKAERLEFSRLGYPAEYTFEQWRDSKRLGRSHNFYSSLKSRDL